MESGRIRVVIGVAGATIAIVVAIASDLALAFWIGLIAFFFLVRGVTEVLEKRNQSKTYTGHIVFVASIFGIAGAVMGVFGISLLFGIVDSGKQGDSIVGGVLLVGAVAGLSVGVFALRHPSRFLQK